MVTSGPSSSPGHDYRVASGGADAKVQVWSVTPSASAKDGQAMVISGNIFVYRVVIALKVRTKILG